MYSAKINKWVKGALLPGACTRQVLTAGCSSRHPSNQSKRWRKSSTGLILSSSTMKLHSRTLSDAHRKQENVNVHIQYHIKLQSLPPPRRICNHHCLPVCLLATLRKNFGTDSHEISREVGNGPMNKWLILMAIWIRDPYCNTGKTSLGGGMRCPSASS